MKWDKSKCVTSAPEDLNVGVTTSVLSSSHCCTQGFSKLESINGCYNDLFLLPQSFNSVIGQCNHQKTNLYKISSIMNMGEFHVGNHRQQQFLCPAFSSVQFSSVQSLSRVWLFVIPWTAANQASLSITNSQSCSNSCPLGQWGHPAITSSVVPFSSCLQSFPASGSFQMSHFFVSGDRSIGALASASVLPMNIQDWFPLGWTDLISLQSKGLSRVFSDTAIQKHQFFSAQLYGPALTWAKLQ